MIEFVGTMCRIVDSFPLLLHYLWQFFTSFFGSNDAEVNLTVQEASQRTALLKYIMFAFLTATISV